MNKRENTEKMASLGRMTRGMIHDLNNSLASILGYSEFLITDLEKGSEQQEFAHNIHRATQQIQDMIDQIRAFSLEKGEGRDLPLHPVDEIKNIARRYEDLTDRQAVIKIHAELGEATVSLPPHQFRTLIGNIVKNAIEASPDGKKNVTISIEDAATPIETQDPPYVLINTCLQAKLAPQALRITITDHGTGMDEIILGLATEAYFSTKSSESAHGVGLTVAKGILEHIGGGLSIATTPGRGTSVTIILPVDSLRQKEIHPSTKSGKRANILLVEDRNLVRDTVEKMLIRQGHSVTSCTNGFDALDHLREYTNGFNLIITDYTMPELDGPNFVTELRNDFPDIPVIIMSGDQQYLRDLNADLGNLNIRVLEKPIEAKRLCNLINDTLTHNA